MTAIRVGSFITATNGLGTGKVLRLEDDVATVEYFESVANRIQRILPLQDLKPKLLSPETRCYIKSDDTDTWIAGRIGKCVGQKYELKLPDLRGGYVHESRLFVRCARPIEDPTDVLVHYGHETAYFAQRRLPFVRILIEQRASSRGMSALLSSNIDLYAHQVEVVRRVLEDPIQRYLLADEVGLGKTIEAGVILRQFLLDDPEGRAVVLVPPLLQAQWRSELTEKCRISEFGERVQILSADEVTQLVAGQYDFMIIDEAHHVASLASNPDDATWNQYKRIAHSVDHLLLLSATPALHNERAFLAMLHLLDPTNYSLDDLSAFRARVEHRQEIGRLLLAINENAADFALKRALDRLESFLGADPNVSKVAEQIRVALDHRDPEDRGKGIRKIRAHLGERYRLYRRLLRNRRSSVDNDVGLGRGDCGHHLVTEYDLHDYSAQLHSALDDWRISAQSLAQQVDDEEAAMVRTAFVTITELSWSWLELLGDALALRLGASASSRLRDSLSESQIQALRGAPRFSDEDTLLSYAQELIGEVDDGDDRVSLLIEVTRQLARSAAKKQERPAKTVVFTSFPPVAEVIAKRLRAAWSEESVSLYTASQTVETNHSELERFETTESSWLLVADRTGEEGLNLQFADILVHFDIPFSPNQLEQRIGRLDRIGRREPMRSRVFLGPFVENSLQEAWFDTLREGFGLFRQSIAPLQFYVDEVLPTLIRAAFEDGAAGLNDQQNDLATGIEAEEVKLREQSTLDEIDARQDESSAFFARLVDFDGQNERLERVTEGWACEVLQFAQERNTQYPAVVKYSPQRGRGPNTLVPYDFLVDQMSRGLFGDRTYERETAVSLPNVGLLRKGDPFLNALSRYVEWDDRGRTSAIWRCVADWSTTPGEEWAGFGFNYIVETDLTPTQELLNEKDRDSGLAAVGRRADSLLPPKFTSVWVGVDGQPVVDTNLLDILQRRYRHPRDYGRDYNLHKHRLAVLREIVDAGTWPATCLRVRQSSEALLRSDPSFQSLTRDATQAAKRRVEDRLLELKLHIEGPLGGSSSALEFEELLGKAIISGIREPALRVDSVHFIVVSGRNPFSHERSDY